MKVIPVDCNYVGPEFASCYLLTEEVNGQKHGFFVECNTNYALPYLHEAIKKEGLKPEQIDGLLLTHIHLDHAGGAGQFLQEFPNAKAYAHPRAAKHLIDPAKLIASATQVYGEEFMSKTYGTILAAPKERVVVLQDGDTIEWIGKIFKTKHTRGHANHHLCMLIDEPIPMVFTGDSFGVSYPVVNRKRGLIMTISTTPTDFDAEAALQTIDWIESLNAQHQGITIALTHFGLIKPNQVASAAKLLRDQVRFSADLVRRIKAEHNAGNLMSLDHIREHIKDWSIQYYANQGIHFDSEDLKILNFDWSVNAQGLLFVAMKPADQ